MQVELTYSNPNQIVWFHNGSLRKYACDRCRLSKLRCNRDNTGSTSTPCQRCTAKKTKCVISAYKKLGKPCPSHFSCTKDEMGQGISKRSHGDVAESAKKRKARHSSAMTVHEERRSGSRNDAPSYPSHSAVEQAQSSKESIEDIVKAEPVETFEALVVEEPATLVVDD